MTHVIHVTSMYTTVCDTIQHDPSHAMPCHAHNLYRGMYMYVWVFHGLVPVYVVSNFLLVTATIRPTICTRCMGWDHKRVEPGKEGYDGRE